MMCSLGVHTIATCTGVLLLVQDDPDDITKRQRQAAVAAGLQFSPAAQRLTTQGLGVHQQEHFSAQPQIQQMQQWQQQPQPQHAPMAQQPTAQQQQFTHQQLHSYAAQQLQERHAQLQREEQAQFQAARQQQQQQQQAAEVRLCTEMPTLDMHIRLAVIVLQPIPKLIRVRQISTGRKNLTKSCFSAVQTLHTAATIENALTPCCISDHV